MIKNSEPSLDQLSNAVKYTYEGQIIFSVILQEADFWKFEVEDTGIGISEEKLSQFFNYRMLRGKITRESKQVN